MFKLRWSGQENIRELTADYVITADEIEKMINEGREMIVADTNLIVYLFITGDKTSLAQEILAKDPHWIVPPLS